MSYSNSPGQGFAVGVNGGQSSFEVSGSNHNAFFRGAVGIGTNEPSAKLDVLGGIKISDSSGGGHNLIVNNGFGGYFNTALDYTYVAKFKGNTVNSSYDAMVITGGYDGGKVGIGTNNPEDKLTVKGRIHAQEVKVDLTGPLAPPDYVFEDGYPLQSLAELGEFIKANNHLPEVPSAKEMMEDGLELKEMNLILLKKIEEITLHLVALKKENEDIKIELKQLKAKN